MSDKARDFEVPDFGLYSENRPKFLPDELLKYAGQWVAWSLDGTRILAHGPDQKTTTEAMKAAGLDPRQAVWDCLPPLDEEKPVQSHGHPL